MPFDIASLKKGNSRWRGAFPYPDPLATHGPNVYIYMHTYMYMYTYTYAFLYMAMYGLDRLGVAAGRKCFLLRGMCRGSSVGPATRAFAPFLRNSRERQASGPKKRLTSRRGVSSDQSANGLSKVSIVLRFCSLRFPMFRCVDSLPRFRRHFRSLMSKAPD